MIAKRASDLNRLDASEPDLLEKLRRPVTFALNVRLVPYVGSGSAAGRQAFEKLPLKTEEFTVLLGRLRLAGVGGRADPGGKSPEKLTSSIAVIDHEFIMRPDWVAIGR